MEFLTIFLYAASATAGVISTNKILSALFEEVLKRRHYRWITRYKDRKDLATAVIAICTEGSTHGWEKLPRDQEHIYFISTLLEAEHKKAAILFHDCISNWVVNATIYSLPSEIDTSKEIRQFSRELQKTAQSSCDKVLVVVKKWR